MHGQGNRKGERIENGLADREQLVSIHGSENVSNGGDRRTLPSCLRVINSMSYPISRSYTSSQPWRVNEESVILS